MRAGRHRVDTLRRYCALRALRYNPGARGAVGPAD